MNDSDGKIALVTASSRGIGAAASALVTRGATFFGSYYRDEQATKTAWRNR